MASTLADINSQIKKHDEQIAQLRKQAEELRNQERSRRDRGSAGEDCGIRVDRGRPETHRARWQAASALVLHPPKAAVKYRGPNGEGWSGGRGRKPRWVTEALAAGKSLSDFEIKFERRLRLNKKARGCGLFHWAPSPTWRPIQLTMTSLPLTPRDPMYA